MPGQRRGGAPIGSVTGGRDPGAPAAARDERGERNGHCPQTQMLSHEIETSARATATLGYLLDDRGQGRPSCPFRPRVVSRAASRAASHAARAMIHGSLRASTLEARKRETGRTARKWRCAPLVTVLTRGVPAANGSVERPGQGSDRLPPNSLQKTVCAVVVVGRMAAKPAARADEHGVAGGVVAEHHLPPGDGRRSHALGGRA